MWKRLFGAIAGLYLLASTAAFGVPFVNVGFSPSGLNQSWAAWGDYDSDGDFDLAAGGKIYRCNGGVLSTTPIVLIDAAKSCSAWGDYDGDGDLDLFVSYTLTSGSAGSKLFRNNGGTFAEVSLTSVYGGLQDPIWIDYDTDGDLDLQTGLYTFQNDHGTLVKLATAKLSFISSHPAVGDFNNDGYMDLACTYSDLANHTYGTKLYTNDGSGIFSNTITLPHGWDTCGSAAADFNADGWLDLCIPDICQFGYPSGPVKVYAGNQSGGFTNINANLPIFAGQPLWGDLDNDGDADLLLTGGTNAYDAATYATSVGINTNGTFSDLSRVAPGYYNGNASLADYDGDGDLDVAITGNTSYNSSIPHLDILRNESTVSNTRPTAPTGLAVKTINQDVILSWNAASDNETPQDGLSYNVRIGTSPGANDICSGMATSSGVRLIPALGNAMMNRSYRIKNLPVGVPIYWSVQSIDSAYAGSPWASGQTVTVWRVSGTITERNGKPIPGVTMARSDSDSTVRTKDDGSYEFLVPAGWTGTITPSRPMSIFSPSSYTYNSVSGNQGAQDFRLSGGFTQALLKTFYESIPTFADLNLDGYLDLVAEATFVNRNGTFSDYIAANGWIRSDVADIDNDGIPDVVRSTVQNGIYVVFNSLGISSKVQLNTSYYQGALAACGDYNNDGNVDMLFTGGSTTNYCCTLYKNNGKKSFTQLPNSALPSAVVSDEFAHNIWGDYDNDGDLDLLVAGKSSAIYRNDSGAFTNIGATLPSTGASAAWGDFDADGDLDMAILATALGHIYRNDNGTFTSIMDLPSVVQYSYKTSMAWADIDNDGDLDLVFDAKVSGSGGITIYRNDSGMFIPLGQGLSGGASFAFGDYDNDGDLDITASGRIYRNDVGIANTLPMAPTGLSVVAQGSTTVFRWNRASDAETPATGLSYNLRVGKTPGGNEVFSGLSLASGKRLMTGMGNVQMNLSWPIKNLLPGRYYWSVQSVDNGYAGSPWAAEQSFIIGTTGNVKKLLINAPVWDVDMPVTAVFGNTFYAEDVNRMYGIRVDCAGHGLQPGDKAKFTGVISVDPATEEAYVAAISVVKSGSLAVVPFVLCNRSLGGGQCGVQKAVGGDASSKGLNNIGMLIKTTGQVKSIDPEGHYFYIDDGSSLRDGTSTNGAENIGVRVEGDGRGYAIGQQVIVTGISSCFKDSDGRILRYLRVREKTTL